MTYYKLAFKFFLILFFLCFYYLCFNIYFFFWVFLFLDMGVYLSWSISLNYLLFMYLLMADPWIIRSQQRLLDLTLFFNNFLFVLVNIFNLSFMCFAGNLRLIIVNANNLALIFNELIQESFIKVELFSSINKKHLI